MTNYDELVQRLRVWSLDERRGDGMLLVRTADAITKLRAERDDAIRHLADWSSRCGRTEADLAAAQDERKEIWWLPWEPQEVARRFHLAYEHFAPDFGYETRPDTKVFDPYSANGQLMIAVVRNVLIEQASSKGMDERDALKADLAAARAKIDSLRHHVKALQLLVKMQHAPQDMKLFAAEVDAIDAALAGKDAL